VCQTLLSFLVGFRVHGSHSVNDIPLRVEIINIRDPADNTVIEVEAQIDGWRDGSFGPYAHVRILTHGTPATTATCSKVLKGLETLPERLFDA